MNNKRKSLSIDLNNGFKICTKCNEKKELNKFSFNKKRNCFYAQCRQCIKSQTKQRFLINYNSNNNLFINIECNFCKKLFKRNKSLVNKNLQKGKTQFCSMKCFNLFNIKKIKTNCPVCHKELLVIPSRFTKKCNKNKKVFCSYKCRAIYNNINRIKGNTRSWIEKWLEPKIKESYPNLLIKFNDRELINPLELDIFIPELKLAFELNGIFHYRPLFGEKHFSKLIRNDRRKHKVCFKLDIKLIIIDIRKLISFNENQAKLYLNKIKEIIDDRIFKLKNPHLSVLPVAFQQVLDSEQPKQNEGHLISPNP